MNDTRKLLIGAVIALMVFFILISLIGADDFIESVSRVPPYLIGLMLVAALVGIVMMGLSFHAISQSLDFGLSRFEGVALITGVMLSHHLTPFGQAGGEPIGAAIVSKRTKQPYETCLAAVSTFDIINVIPAILVFIFGGLYVAIFNPIIPANLRPYIGAFSIFILTMVALFGLIYRWPRAAQAVLQRLVGGLNRALDYFPFTSSLDPSRLNERLYGYTSAVGIVSGDRWTIAKASTFSTLAFVAQGIMLWLSLFAVDVELSLILAIVIVPISLLAAVIPLPGSGGGIEAVQITLVMVLTGAPFTPTLTAVVLSRGIVYWLPILLGTITIVSVYHADPDTAI